MTWQLSTPFNPTARTHQINLSLGEDSLSDLLELQDGETLEFQEEYPQEAAEEAEEVAEEEKSLLQYPHHKEPLMQGTSLSEIHRSHLQEIARNRKPS